MRFPRLIRYVRLQNIYRAKAQEDADEVAKYVQFHLESVGRPVESISQSFIR